MGAAMQDGPLSTLLHRIEDRCNRGVTVLEGITQIANEHDGLDPVFEAAIECVTADLRVLSDAALAARHDPDVLETTVTDLQRRLGEKVA
jgi:hypothetical protein